MKTWIIDTAHSEIAFKIKHLMISTVRGKFGTFEGSITASDDAFTDATASFSADVASIHTNNAGRDGHLVSADFFDVEKFPKLSFVSTLVTISGSQLEIVGDMTIKGITKQQVLIATFNGITNGMDGKRVAVFDLSGKLNRNDYGLTWNNALEAGGFVLGDEVTIECSVEAKEV